LTQNVATAFRKLLQNESGPQVVVERALQALEGAALQTNDEFGAREIINTLHIMAKTSYLAVVPKLEGRAEALAGTFNAQGVANTLWAAGVFAMLRSPDEGSRWVHTVAQRLVSLGKAVCLNTAELCQLH
jgi:hypothetical protein